VDFLRIGEANLPLRGVHVDVHPVRGHGEVEERRRVAAAREPVAVRLEDRVTQQTIPHRPAVDKQVETRGIASVRIGAGDEPPDPERALAVLGRHERLGFAIGEHGCDAVQGVFDGRPVDRRPVVTLDVEVDPRQRERGPRHPVGDVPPLGGRRLEELAACGNSREQLRDLDARSFRPSHASVAEQPPLLDEKLDALARAARTGAQPQARDRGDCRQGLSAKAEAPDPVQILEAAQLAGGVALERQARILDGHPEPIVGHGHQGRPALADLYTDP